jgi:hypothetical protein
MHVGGIVTGGGTPHKGGFVEKGNFSYAVNHGDLKIAQKFIQFLFK